MALYKITIKLLSPIITPLKGDTIWGHVVWGIANHEGDEAVEQFLAKQKQEPEIIVSSAFPAGYLCRPLPLPKKRTESLDAEKYTEIKKEKKRRLAKACDYLDGIDAPKLDLQSAPLTNETVTHNTIDRESGTVLDGGLYSVEEDWVGFIDESGNYVPANEFDIYAESTLPPERIETLFEWAFENGFGADSSIGKGKIEIVPNSTAKATPKHSTSTYMALAPFVGSEKVALENLRADTFTRSGRLGGRFAGELSPFKKTVVFFAEGAVFDCKEKILWCGKLLENIHADSRICQAGFAPVIPIPEDMNYHGEQTL